MDAFNELELRRLLQNRKAEDTITEILKLVLGSALSWEEKRPLWYFLYRSGHHQMLLQSLKIALENKERIPFDLLIQVCGEAGIEPTTIVMEALVKGLKKQAAWDDILGVKSWDRFDERLRAARTERLQQMIDEQKRFKEGLREKFQFLRDQRMTDQAGRVLRRMLELYPDDSEIARLKHEFDEVWAREVIATHINTLHDEPFERVVTSTSAADEQMLKAFLIEGEKMSLEHREVALDLAIAFWFLEDYGRALEILAWAPGGPSSDWMKAEVLFAGRRYVEALEFLTTLEMKYIQDPETTFAVCYLRAQCLKALGQDATALEVMQSIVHIRPHYRSAHALILEWAEGGGWR